MTTCFEELFEGVSVTVNKSRKQASMRFANLNGNTIKNKTLVDLQGPDKDLLKQQLELVAAYADLRGDRGAEIIDQLTAPVGYWSAVLGLSAHRHKKTIQLIEITLALCVQVEMRFKHIFATLRPVEFSPQIQPMIPTPGHGSWPSGHATEAFAVAQMLQPFMNQARPGKKDGENSQVQLQRLAARIAVNRTVAGVHFPVDSAAGRLLGGSLGEFFVARATGGSVRLRGFDSARFVDADGSPKDFKLSDPLDAGAYSVSGPAIALPKADTLAWLWQEALKEWA
ncbi:MAG: phosphatase PAP2 family protein [Hydrogenophaga sp.]|jgi:membrane-associated phospholipid phosphatase|nr:phosphatase PAP2 family protein [Hydrogenophaga sp.]